MLRSLDQNTRWHTGQFVVIAMLGVSALVIGGLIGADILGPKPLIVLFAGLFVLLFAAIGNDRTLRLTYFFAVATFALGHRSLYVGQYTYFVPSELIVWVLFFSVLARFVRTRQSSGRIPGILVFFTVWSLLSMLLTPDIVQQWDHIFPDSKTWILGLPLFVITLELISDTSHLRAILRILVVVALYMSLMALVEYRFPEIANRFPWFFNPSLVFLDTIEGFIRSSFGFWGNPIGVILVAWGVLVALDELLNGRDRGWQIVAAVTCIAGVGAVYVAGQRGTWVSLPIGISLLVFLSGYGGLVLLAPLAILAGPLSTDFMLRLESIVPGSLYFTYDTSIQKRLAFYRTALDRILADPLFGFGWGGGLVHNEFLGFGSHLGLPALVAFIFLLIQILRRLITTYLHAPSTELRRFSRLFLALFVTWVIDFNFQPVLSVATIAVPCWFMLSLAWRLPNLSNDRIVQMPGDARQQFSIAKISEVVN